MTLKHQVMLIVFDEILLDFAKALDLIPHKRLVHKLATYGIADGLLSLFEQF
jgi:hypothetical protein